jgi:hypothetical protein
MIRVKLVPKKVEVIQSVLQYNVIGIASDGQSFQVHYILSDSEGWKIEEGNKTLPIQALSSISSGVADIPAMNQVLAAFGIEALLNQNDED